MKVCRKCGIEKSLEDFPKRKSAKDGRRNECAACTNAKMREYVKNPSYSETNARYAEANRAYIRERGRKYHAENKEKVRQYHRAYYLENRTQALLKSKQWRLANPERYKTNQTAYVLSRQEARKEYRKTYYKANAERIRVRRLQWAKDNPSKQRAQGARYKAAQLRATPPWADKALVQEFYDAAEFLGMVTGEWYHVDHIVPLRSKLVCGFHAQQNLAVIPGAENCSKSNRHWPDMP